MQSRPVLGLNESLAAVNAMIAAAKSIPGRPVAVLVVDHHGDAVAFACEANANPLLARQNARKKALTSACMRVDTMVMAQRLTDQGRTLADFGNPDLYAGGGGVVITRESDGYILGGIGVSGRTDEEDQQLAEIGLTALRGAV